MSQEGVGIGRLPTLGKLLRSNPQGGKQVLQHFFKGVSLSSPQWELPLVLEALVADPCWPLERSCMQVSSFIQESFAACAELNQESL